MKIFYQVIIILFIIVALFILRNDVKSVIQNISNNINNNDNSSETVNLDEKREIKLMSKIDMPGALQVASDFFSLDDDKVILFKDNIISLTNKYRKENGNLSPLKENQSLNLSAEKKLQDMFNKQYFEHISPDGKGVGDLSDEVGYDYILIGENLATGNFKDDLALIDAWMRSKGHRANILNENYIDIGVAVAHGNLKGKNIWMAVQHFGVPSSICPAVDPVIFGSIDINQNKLSAMQEELTIRQDMINKKAVYEGDTYPEQIYKYNSLIKPYNNLVLETKQKITDYNIQVDRYNACILDHQ